ncbi:uncharacterized protein LOC142175383 [Nicotiana tabacum]|uniref:Uncharacterized protein LOC142175383 n=1 Tax=Nicotiana tabacum TaxID=4097 RepID=A0AC58TLH9_TOBAC
MDPLKYIFQKPIPTGRLAKWQILLTEFDIIYVTRIAMKAQALADHLAENTVDDEYDSLNTYFPDEEVNLVEEIVQDDSKIWKLYFDRAVNIKGVGIGTILVSPTGQHYPATARLRLFYTNNTSEYEACIMGLNMAINLNVHELLVMGDSDLLIWQAQGDWETRDIKLIPYRQCVEDLSKRFKSIEFRYIPRFLNELADALATLSSMLPYPELYPMSTPWPFVSWGMDVIGPIEPKASNGHIFILVAIDYFTKWVKTIILKAVTKKAVVDFVHSNIICRIAVIPAEVEIPSLRIIVEAGIEDTEWVKSRLEQLSLIDEKRLAAEKPKRKFAPNWQGPYLIKKVVSKGALHLADIEGKVTDISVNADAVKRYYV